MPAPMPPQAGGPPPSPQGPGPQGQAPAPQSGGAAQVVSQISDGFQKLEKMMASAGPAIGPQEKQMLGSLMSGFQALVAELGKPAGAPPGSAPGPSGPPKAPMPANAARGSQPTNISGG